MSTPRIVCALVGALFLTGCASVRVDEQGRTHVAGFVWMTLPKGSSVDKGADQVRTRSVGVTVTQGPLGSSVVLGWSDQTLARIENDAAVRLRDDTR
jgi:hypothetical protein